MEWERDLLAAQTRHCIACLHSARTGLTGRKISQVFSPNLTNLTAAISHARMSFPTFFYRADIWQKGQAKSIAPKKKPHPLLAIKPELVEKCRGRKKDPSSKQIASSSSHVSIPPVCRGKRVLHNWLWRLFQCQLVNQKRGREKSARACAGQLFFLVGSLLERTNSFNCFAWCGVPTPSFSFFRSRLFL